MARSDEERHTTRQDSESNQPDGAARGCTNFTSDLDAWLRETSGVAQVTAQTERYQVDHILRETSQEITEVVYRYGADGKDRIGPFVRKRFREDAGRGYAYLQILRAQTRGVILQHQPLIYECEQSGESLDVVMEYLSGETLRDLAMRDGAGVAFAARIMPDLCDAVSELHESFEQPLIHRDVKPSNVIVNGDRLKLIDLGIARTYRNDAAHDTMRYGTPGYAPPEQYGYGQTSTRSDVYALGMTLAFCLTGEDPAADLRERLLADPRVPQELRPALSKATEFDPQRRYATAREFKQDLELAFVAIGSKTAGMQSRPGATPAPAIPTPPHAPTQDSATSSTSDTRPERPQRFTVLGRIWNGLLVVVWVVFGFVCVTSSINPSQDMAESNPHWLIPFIFLVFFYGPFSCLVYLLLDKRRLRKHEPFSRYTWRNELPICLSIAFVCVAFTLLLKFVFG